MKTLFTSLVLPLFLSSFTLQAQNSSYIVNTANASDAGGSNTFVGPNAGKNNLSGNSNTFIGWFAGTKSEIGNENVFVGSSTGNGNVSGSRNTFLGKQAGYLNSVGSDNVYVGYTAGGFNGSGNQNTIVGTGAGALSSGSASANTFIGYRAGLNTIGNFNSFIGVQAGLNNTTGSSNYFFGTNSGLNNTTGTGNYFLGDNAGGGNSTGGFNVYIGANAGNGTGVNGDNNLAIGFEAGRANQSGINNTFIGFRADAGAVSLSNATAIGNGARVNVSNALVLGNGANVGIGTSSPTARLHVATGEANISGLRLENLTSASPASASGQGKFLTVDGSGNVILANVNGSGRQVANGWEANGEYLQSTNLGGVIVGQGIDKTPAGYNLFVSKGILTEKVKVAVKNTADWSDYVFTKRYKLRSLTEVEQFISQHKHLPGVPSANEVVKQGLDVATMDAKLLEKVEELTLYTIQLEKANQKQQQEIDELKNLVKQLLQKR